MATSSHKFAEFDKTMFEIAKFYLTGGSQYLTRNNKERSQTEFCNYLLTFPCLIYSGNSTTAIVLVCVKDSFTLKFPQRTVQKYIRAFTVINDSQRKVSSGFIFLSLRAKPISSKSFHWSISVTPTSVNSFNGGRQSYCS